MGISERLCRTALRPPGRMSLRVGNDILDELNGPSGVCVITERFCEELIQRARGGESGKVRRPGGGGLRLGPRCDEGEIMAQRVVIGTCVLVAAACLGLVGLLLASRRSRRPARRRSLRPGNRRC